MGFSNEIVRRPGVRADPGISIERPPVLLAPMAAILGDRVGRMSMSSQMMRTILDSVAIRLDEAREISRYVTGLLIYFSVALVMLRGTLL